MLHFFFHFALLPSSGNLRNLPYARQQVFPCQTSVPSRPQNQTHAILLTASPTPLVIVIAMHCYETIARISVRPAFLYVNISSVKDLPAICVREGLACYFFLSKKDT